MTGPMSDRVAAELALILDHQENGDLREFATRDSPRLLALAEGVLKLHRPQDKPVHSWDHICPEHSDKHGFGHLGRLRQMRDCPDCRFSDVTVCRHCSCPNDEWPCPTYLVAAAALLRGEN